MREIALGNTGIVVPQNAFGALPIQRVSEGEAVALLHRAFEGGMRFFDTARSYSDSEQKMGAAFGGMWEQLYVATKTQATTPDAFWKDLETSLSLLKTERVDLYQFHNVTQVFKPGDGTGMYECMLQAREQGKIGHIGITTHSIDRAYEAVECGLYETLQYPFSYLSSPRELELARLCEERGMGFIAMKGLAGGLLTNSRAIMAFVAQYPVLPIWGVQRMEELEEWLGYMDETPQLTPELQAVIDADRAQMADGFCRSCGYCMPCPEGIQIFQLARMNMLLRRMPTQGWLSEKWQGEVLRSERCTECRACQARCPYQLDIPRLLRENREDYWQVLKANS